MWLKKRGRKIGICGQAPSDFPEFATFLVECGIDSISLIPDTVVKTRLAIAKKEKEMRGKDENLMIREQCSDDISKENFPWGDDF